MKINLAEYNRELREKLGMEALSLYNVARGGGGNPLHRVLVKAAQHVIAKDPHFADNPDAHIDNESARRLWLHVVMAQITQWGAEKRAADLAAKLEAAPKGHMRLSNN